METKKGQLYIGGESAADESALLKVSALTTHGVIFGMTGSGKTGLGVNMLEEALLSAIPTLIRDPKGDMGKLRFNYPEHAKTASLKDRYATRTTSGITSPLIDRTG